eukprot:SAG11_NODE_37919_length_254_cov_1.645161_1_plen_44_part_10
MVLVVEIWSAHAVIRHSSHDSPHSPSRGETDLTGLEIPKLYQYK